MTRSRPIAFTLVELLVVICLLAALVAVLLPTLSRARSAAMSAKLAADERALVQTVPEPATEAPPTLPPALVQSLDAKVGLTPRLSVGTAQPESIYQATFDATLIARGSAAEPESEIQLPLPPQIISLGDLSLLIDGQASDAVHLAGDKLVWRGPLPPAPTEIRVQYTAMGRGLYTLQPPPGRIIDQFRIELAANGSDVRMLELSLQPTSLSRGSSGTTYVWEYSRLMFGRPISLDVLGIAPIDRLGELSWLGPLSVIVFGLVIGLVSRAYEVHHFDRWMLLLVLGTFTGAYPLMYFAQQFIPLEMAMLISSALVLVIIAVRLVSIMGLWLGIIGVTLPAGMIMFVTLLAAVQPHLQGILLTGMAMGLFVLAMLLAPRIRALEPPPEILPAV